MRLTMYQVQSLRPGRGHYRHHLRFGEPHFDDCDRRHKLRTDRREDLGYICRRSIFTCCDQFFRRPYSPVFEQHVDNLAFGRYQLLLYRRVGESAYPPIGKVRFLNLQRRYGWGWSWLERSSVTCLCGGDRCTHESIHHHWYAEHWVAFRDMK